MSAGQPTASRGEMILALSFYPSTIGLVVAWLEDLDRRVQALEKLNAEKLP